MRRISLAIALGVTFLAIKNTKASKKTISLEQRYGDNFVGVWTAIQALQTDVTSLNSDFSSISGLAGNASFLANLSMLPHQSDTNSTLPGVCGWANNHTDNMVSNGFMHP